MLLAALAERIPANVYYQQNWCVGATNWLPFHWKGYSQSTRYTYRLDLTVGEGEIWSGMAQKNRNTIRKARDRFGVSVERTEDLEALLGLNKAVFSRQGLPLPYSRELVEKIFNAAQIRGEASIWIARERNGAPSAGALIVNDGTSAYYLLGGADPELRSSGSQSLLLWSAIANEVGSLSAFDFEGSMIQEIETSFRSFGSIQVPYFAVSGARSKMINRLVGLQRIVRSR